ncbi:MAG: hypothetical protein LBT76_03615 [Tannerella sp.]|jgi:hypothetical protein|nr:hypothetical protein [Tannerella sp.]
MKTWKETAESFFETLFRLSGEIFITATRRPAETAQPHNVIALQIVERLRATSPFGQSLPCGQRYSERNAAPRPCERSKAIRGIENQELK